MKTKREEKLENELTAIRKELHGSKQKIRDMEKSRRSDREKLKSLNLSICLLTDELKKKR